MPLTKRLVEPVHICREKIPPGIKNELEFVSNTALANIIQQLSSLSKHAEDIFAELTTESVAMIHRTNSLKNRVDRLQAKVASLDCNVEEVTLHDINIRKHFRSANNWDQQVVNRETMANAMKDTYDMCDPPPPLNRLNQFRTDGKDGLKFYTDPDYFFELWKQKMLEVGDRHRSDKARRPGRARTPNETKVSKLRQPQSHLDAVRAKALEANFQPVPATNNQRYSEVPQTGYPLAGAYNSGMSTMAANYDVGRYGTIRSGARPGRLELPISNDTPDPTYLEETVHMVNYRQGSVDSSGGSGVTQVNPLQNSADPRNNQRGTPTRPNQPPPAPPMTGSGPQSTRSTPVSSREQFPPPPPDMHGRRSPTPGTVGGHDFPPPPSEVIGSGMGSSAPPPPPPPPGGILPPLSSGGHIPRAPDGPSSSTMVKASAPATVQVSNTMLDARNDLLKAIRTGINLRKVEQQEAQQQAGKAGGAQNSLHTVAEILMRRKAIHHSDSDTSSEAGDSEWNDDI